MNIRTYSGQHRELELPVLLELILQSVELPNGQGPQSILCEPQPIRRSPERPDSEVIVLVQFVVSGCFAVCGSAGIAAGMSFPADLAIASQIERFTLLKNPSSVSA